MEAAETRERHLYASSAKRSVSAPHESPPSLLPLSPFTGPVLTRTDIGPDGDSAPRALWPPGCRATCRASHQPGSVHLGDSSRWIPRALRVHYDRPIPLAQGNHAGHPARCLRRLSALLQPALKLACHHLLDLAEDPSGTGPDKRAGCAVAGRAMVARGPPTRSRSRRRSGRGYPNLSRVDAGLCQANTCRLPS